MVQPFPSCKLPSISPLWVISSSPSQTQGLGSWLFRVSAKTLSVSSCLSSWMVCAHSPPPGTSSFRPMRRMAHSLTQDCPYIKSFCETSFSSAWKSCPDGRREIWPDVKQPSQSRNIIQCICSKLDVSKKGERSQQPSLSPNPQRGAALGSPAPQALQVVNGAQINLPSGHWAGRGATAAHCCRSGAQPLCRERGEPLAGILLSVCQPWQGLRDAGTGKHMVCCSRTWHTPWQWENYRRTSAVWHPAR